MLGLLNNFIAPTNKAILDKKSNKCYLLMQKCGTQSLLELSKRFPDRFVQITSEEFISLGVETVTVFIREPIGRYISGITTQMALYQIPEKVFERMLNLEQTVPMLDTHTMPQFWFLLRFGSGSKLNFNIEHLDNIKMVHDDIRQLNVNPASGIKISKTALDKIDYAMTEDIVLHNNFLGRTVTISDVISRITKEHQYYAECNQYKNILSYMWENQ